MWLSQRVRRVVCLLIANQLSGTLWAELDADAAKHMVERGAAQIPDRVLYFRTVIVHTHSVAKWEQAGSSTGCWPGLELVWGHI
jgi:hypothetical protein